MKCLLKWLLAFGLLAGLAALVTAFCCQNDAPDYITLYSPEDDPAQNDFGL